MSFASSIPLTSSLSLPNIGYLECPDSIIFSRIEFISSSMPKVTISTFGTIISFTVVFPNLMALFAIDSASLSIIFKSTASFRKSVTSETD